MSEDKQKTSRRDLLKYSIAGAATAVAATGCAGLGGGKALNPGNAAFYTKDGAFDSESSKEVYFSMMKAFGYPISDVLRTDELWLCDFVQRDFEKLGMAGIFWINAKSLGISGGPYACIQLMHL